LNLTQPISTEKALIRVHLHKNSTSTHHQQTNLQQIPQKHIDLIYFIMIFKDFYPNALQKSKERIQKRHFPAFLRDISKKPRKSYS